MSKLVALLRLTRAEHSIMLIIAVIAAEFIAKGIPSPSLLVLSLIAPASISMASFAINDYFDVAVDKANKRMRPIVTGELTKDDALLVTAAGMLIGIIASAFINVQCFAIALIFGILALLYSYRLKEILLIGNAYIAFSMAIPYIFGSYVVSNSIGAGIAIVAVLTFLSGIAREIHGTIRDLRGDHLRKAKTIPRAIGIRNSAVLAMCLYLAAVVLSLYLFMSVPPFRDNLAYLPLILASDCMLLYISVGYLGTARKGFYDFARNLSLVAMSLALLAFLLSPIKLLP